MSEGRLDANHPDGLPDVSGSPDDKVRDALTDDQRLSLITAIHDVYRRTGPAIEPSSIDIVLAVEGAVVRMLATVRADAQREALLSAAANVKDLNSGWDGPGITQGHERSRFARWLRRRAEGSP